MNKLVLIGLLQGEILENAEQLTSYQRTLNYDQRHRLKGSCMFPSLKYRKKRKK